MSTLQQVIAYGVVIVLFVSAAWLLASEALFGAGVLLRRSLSVLNDSGASPGARIIPLDNGFILVPDPDRHGIDSDGGDWSPFDCDGNLRDLEAEGWHRMGALKDGA